ncbi:PmoA family protein [Geofilum rubicundum]|nr:PmoA family protein [Geofilum rubicundum]
MARFEVSAGDYDRKDVFVHAPVQLTAACLENGLELFEVTDNGEYAVAFQLEEGKHPRLWWQVEGRLKQGSIRFFELRAGDKKSNDSATSIRKNDVSYILFNGFQPVLQYNHAKAALPDGVDTAYSRSGFIHPLYSPSGKILTMIQPPDHMHHYGLWNAWTRTQFKGKSVDFWNLGDKQGRVDYAGTISTIQGDVFQSLKTLQQHVAFNDKGGSDVALNEELEVRVFNAGRDLNRVDYISSFNCAQPEGLFLEEYRYGGFVFRGSEKWNGYTVQILTSEGRHQDNSDGHPAQWCMVNETGKQPSGILIMSHPANFNHPEPLRTWDRGSNGGLANIFINFCPIRNRSWEMVFGQRYTMQYRVVTFDGRWTKEQAEQEWVDFAHPPTVKVMQ